jgi:hypothetical protein
VVRVAVVQDSLAPIGRHPTARGGWSIGLCQTARLEKRRFGAPQVSVAPLFVTGKGWRRQRER